MELCDLQNDLSLKNLKQSGGIDFWKHESDEKYPKLHNTIVRCFSVYCSTYICESTFSHMKFIKSNQRNRLSDIHLEGLLRIATTSSIPINFDTLVANFKLK